MIVRTLQAFILALAAVAANAQNPAQPPNTPPDTDALVKDTLLKSARAAYAKGDYAAARASLEQAWDLVQTSPPADPKRYDIPKQLEAVLSAAGDYAKAEEYLEYAINWRELNVGQGDPKLAAEWIEMATLCQRLKDFDRAHALLTHAMGRDVQTYGRESLPVADDFSRIALAFTADNKPEPAIQPLQMAIKIREAVLGAEHPAILSELDRLGGLQLALRNYPDAEESFRRSLVIRERLTGPNSADLISSVEGLAYSQFGQKKYDEAEKGYQRLLALWVSSTGQPDHPMIALTLDKIAVFYRAQERWEEGAAAEARAISIRQMFLANAFSSEAAEAISHKNPKEAERRLRQALAVLDESRADQDKLRQQTEENLKALEAEDKPAPRSPPKSTTKSTAKKQPE
jgi:tetratricopeptide (TPR) repeat protein